MDTPIQITMICDGDNHEYRNFIKRYATFHDTIEFLQELYKLSGYQSENEK